MVGILREGLGVQLDIEIYPSSIFMPRLSRQKTILDFMYEIDEDL